MLNWITAHPELLIGILASPIFVAFGYFQRKKIEHGDNLREALYILLEVWHRISVLSKSNIDPEWKTICKEIRAIFPKTEIAEAELESAKKDFEPIVLKMIWAKAFEDFDGLQIAFSDIIRLISRSDPIFAYRLDCVHSIMKTLSFLDQYFKEIKETIPQSTQGAEFFLDLSKKFTAHQRKEIVDDLEAQVLGLARRHGVISYLKVKNLIKDRHKLFSSDELPGLKEAFAELLPPLMATHFVTNKSSTAQVP